METVSSTTGKYASVNGINMYYELHGEGQPLVLLHGGGSTIQTTFGKILPLLAQSHRVIAVELQAHGHTSDRETPESFVQDADDVAELLRQLDVEKANIFGFSNGGQTCIELGLRHTDKINKLVIASAFYKKAGIPSGFWDGFEGATLSNMPQVYQEEYLKINNDPAALQNMFNRDVERMKNFKDWRDDDLRSISAPTLIVQGDQDLSFTEHAVEMSRLFPNARLAILPGNHGSYMGEAMSPDPNSKVPGLFVALLNDFLAEPEIKNN